jgi:mannosyltransferase
MGKKREDRGKEKARTDRECNLDGDYVSPVRSCRDLSIDTIRDTLYHNRYIQILLSLTIIGLILRFYNIGYNSLWLDEASTLTFASMSLPGIWEATTGGEFNPPLFYWIEHIMLVFGNNEAILRFVPALFGVLTIPLIYLIGKEFVDRNVGIIAAAACTFSPFLIFYSQEARAYSMGLFFIALAMVFFLKALKTNEITHWALFGLCSALAFWTHFYTLVITGALVLYALAVKIPEFRKDIREFKPLILAGAIFAIISLPLIIVTVQLFAKRTASAPTFGIQGMDIIIETFRQLSGFSEIVMYLFLILFVIGIIQAFLLDRNKGILLVTLTLLPFVISWVLSYRIPMVPRYLIILAPVYFIGIALAYKPAFGLVKNHGVIYGFMALLVLLSVTTPFFTNYYSSYTKEDWRGFSGQISELTKPGDIIVVAPGYIDQPFDYYYSNSTDGTIELHADTGMALDAIRQQKGNNSMYLVVTGDISSANPNGDAVTWIQEHAQLISQNTGIYLFTVQ